MAAGARASYPSVPMLERPRPLAASLSVLCLAACGGATAPPPTQAELDAEDDADRYADEEPAEDEASTEGGLDPALLRAEVEPLTLGEPVALPGTGVTMRPPEGADPMPLGSGFLATRQRVQITVVVAVGEEDLLDAIRAGGAGRVPEAEAEEEVTIDGQTGRLGRDRVRTPAGVLERSWLLVHDGARGLGVVATYEAARAEAYRGPLRQALSGVSWDREASLDAAAALGITLDPVEGLERSHRSTANLVMLAPGGEFPPQAGQVVLTVAPLPMQVPPDQVDAVCGRLAARLVPAPADDVQHEGPVEDGTLPGCERLATAPTSEGPRVVTYAALMFHEGTPLLLTGSVDAEALSTWRPRFASAARSLRLAE